MLMDQERARAATQADYRDGQGACLLLIADALQRIAHVLEIGEVEINLSSLTAVVQDCALRIDELGKRSGG